MALEMLEHAGWFACEAACSTFVHLEKESTHHDMSPNKGENLMLFANAGSSLTG